MKPINLISKENLMCPFCVANQEDVPKFGCRFQVSIHVPVFCKCDDYCTFGEMEDCPLLKLKERENKWIKG